MVKTPLYTETEATYAEDSLGATVRGDDFGPCIAITTTVTVKETAKHGPSDSSQPWTIGMLIDSQLADLAAREGELTELQLDIHPDMWAAQAALYRSIPPEEIRLAYLGYREEFARQAARGENRKLRSK